MTRKLLRATTAIAVCFSLTAPTAILAASSAPGAFQLAQADNAGKNGKAKGRDGKGAEAEVCADGAEPPCSDAAKAEEAGDASVKDETKGAEAPGRKKKAEKAAEEGAATPAEQKAEEAPAETAPTATEASEAAPEKKAEDGASAEQEAKRDKKKKKDEARADDSAPPAAVTEAPKAETEEKAPEVAAPAEEPKSAETAKPVVADEPKQEAEAAPKAEPEAAPAAEAADKPAVAEAEAPRKRERKSAAAAEDAAPVGVTTETVTEETTRTSDEEVPVAKSGDRKKDKSDDLVKILGAAAGGVVVGALLNEALGGGKVVDSTGDRVIIERNGEYIVRKDENEIMRRPGSDVRTETFRDGSSRTVVERENGVRVVTIRDADGYIVRRSRILTDGREVLLFDDTRDSRDTRRVRIEESQLPRYERSRDRRYVDYSAADRGELRRVLLTPPVASFDQRYTLRQVRENERLRDVMPRLDLDVVTFDTGSAALTPSQARKLDPLGWAMQDILRDNPEEVFLIEGHTDAVGSQFSNLILSDRRAETVALALTEYYEIPPENLITQGYGEEFLKIETDGPERANRRAAVRRITPLLEQTVRR